MWEYVFAAFLVIHGLVHLTVWLAPATDDAPFRADHSWLLGSGETPHRVSVALAVSAAAVFVAAGTALLLGAAVWGPLAVTAAALGLTVALLYFNPWLLLDIGINAGLLYALLATDWADTLIA
jgi:hypothetical protein